MMQELAFALVCYGAVETPGGNSATTFVDGMPVATTHFGGTRQIADVAYADVRGGIVRVKPPASIVPDIAGRGEDGWRTLGDVTISEREISGRFRLNWINRPTVRIDRMTGVMEITGGDVVAGRSTFRGDCERVSETQQF